MQIYILNTVLNIALSTFDKCLWKEFALPPHTPSNFRNYETFYFFFVGGGQNISIQLIFSRTYGSLTPTHWETFRNIVSHNLLIWTNYWKHFNFQLDWDIQHIAFVVSPLKSLMADHVNTLKEINIRSNLIEPDMSTEAIAVYFFLLCTFPNLQ